MIFRDRDSEVGDFGNCGKYLTYLEMMPFIFMLIVILLGAMILHGGGDDTKGKVYEDEKHKQILRFGHTGGEAVSRRD